MSELIYTEDSESNQNFWNNATKYTAASSDDEKFVSEMAYMMVTLHKTGA